MKLLIGALAAVVITASSSYGQGALVFVNRVVGLFDAPVILLWNGEGAGTLGPVEAQLWTAGPGAEMLGSTTFRGTEGQLAYYLLPVDVIINGNTGTPIDVMIRFVLGGMDLPSSAYPVTVIPGVPPNPPANLNLDGPIYIVPEPSLIALATMGASALLFHRRRLRK